MKSIITAVLLTAVASSAFALPHLPSGSHSANTWFKCHDMYSLGFWNLQLGQRIDYVLTCKPLGWE